MFEKIKTFYIGHKLYVNIAVGVLVVFVGWKLLKRK